MVPDPFFFAFGIVCKKWSKLIKADLYSQITKKSMYNISGGGGGERERERERDILDSTNIPIIVNPDMAGLSPQVQTEMVEQEQILTDIRLERPHEYANWSIVGLHIDHTRCSNMWRLGVSFILEEHVEGKSYLPSCTEVSLMIDIFPAVICGVICVPWLQKEIVIL